MRKNTKTFKLFYSSTQVLPTTFQIPLVSASVPPNPGCALYSQTPLTLYRDSATTQVGGKLMSYVATSLEPDGQTLVHANSFQIQPCGYKGWILLQGASEEPGGSSCPGSNCCHVIFQQTGQHVLFQVLGGTKEFANVRGQAVLIVNPTREIVIDVEFPKKPWLNWGCC